MTGYSQSQGVVDVDFRRMAANDDALDLLRLRLPEAAAWTLALSTSSSHQYCGLQTVMSSELAGDTEIDGS